MLEIRPETPEDSAEIRHVNEEAFGQKEEGELVDKLRNHGVLTISLVAIRDGGVVGHIAFSPVVIESESASFEAIALAPMRSFPRYSVRVLARKWFGQVLKNAAVLDRI